MLAEEGDPGVLLLRLFPPPLGELGVDGQGGLLGQAQHLRVRLARELVQDQRLGPDGVGVGQVPECLDDRAGLRQVRVPSSSRAPMPGRRARCSQASHAVVSADWVEQASAAASS